MIRRDFGIGEGTVQGNIHTIWRIGEVKLSKVMATKLSAIGELYMEESHIKRVKLTGEATLVNSSFERMSTKGQIICRGIVKGHKMSLTGELEAECLKIEFLRIGNKKYSNTNNLAKIKGTIVSKTTEMMIPVKLEAELECENMICYEHLKSKNELECVNFYGFNKLNVEGINSDYIYINPMGKSKINYLTGSKIIITKNFNIDSKFKTIPKTVSDRRYQSNIIRDKGKIVINSIEADDIYLENVKAKYVSGNNVVVGKNCEIETLEHMGHVDVSDNSSVKNVKENFNEFNRL